MMPGLNKPGVVRGIMRRTALEDCISHLRNNEGSTAIFPYYDGTRYHVRGGYGWSSRTIKSAISELNLISIPGYQSAHVLPVGSEMYIFQSEKELYATERTDNTP